jgi:hypothetical protein
MRGASRYLSAAKNSAMNHWLLPSTYFPFAAIHRSILLITHSRKTGHKVSTLI